MSTFAVSVERQTTQAKTSIVVPAWQLAVAVCLAQLAVLPASYSAWITWTSDPLRSVGIVFPLVSLLFLLRSWRRFDQPLQPSVWGLIPAAVAIATLWLHEHIAVHLFVSRALELGLMPVGLSLALMFAAILLLVGGMPLLRAMTFPVLLFGLTDPVPHLFSHFDLPLQQASALAARNFATLIGEHPTGVQLQLMFTPNFGMFIAPGCNGIRGAVTLGYLGLFAAAWCRFSVRRCLAFFATGIAVGYLFNLLRLCLLVVYYKAGQWFPSVQPYGTQVDYVIGGTLFLIASYALGSVVFRRTETADQTARARWFGPTLLHSRAFTRNMIALTLLCLVPALVHVSAVVRDAREARVERETAERFPSVVGSYHLVTTWNEFSDEQIMVYRWARYSDGNPAHDVSLGIWLLRGEHDIRYCHAVRGEQLYPQPGFTHQMPGLKRAEYDAYVYDDGTNDVLVASLRCQTCRSRAVHQLGPLKFIAADPTTYFRGPHPQVAVVLHAAPRLTSTPAEIRQPIDAFLAHLDETTFLSQDKSTP